MLTTREIRTMEQSDAAEENQEHTEPLSRSMSRRDLLLGLGAVALAAGAGTAAGSSMPGHHHEEHAPKHTALLDATNACIDKGRRCIAHCLVAWREGDLELAECAAKVHEMEVVCEGLAYLLTANSSYSRQYAALCDQVCRDCAKECEKHDDHIECRECGEACETLVEAIKKAFA
jgi:Cys-rich four helix bundle protein (predicted Tat secretion target)